MKNKRFIIATVLVAMATTVAIVSCKKEDQEALQSVSQPVKTFTVPQIDDMNAYLKGFKQKMKESQNAKDAEYLSLEEAAWHLSSVANYDFGRVNVRYTDLYYDTLYYQVNVTDGHIELSDLNILYAIMASDIESLYQSLNMQEKHIRLIGASIAEDGQVVIDLVISYFILDHTWYFENDFNAALACVEYFDSNTYYGWNSTAVNQLKQAINAVAGQYFILPGETPAEREYYVPTRDVVFNYENHTDTIGSPFYGNSRIFVVRSNGVTNPTLGMYEMCYCLDSYLALPFELMQNNPSVGTDTPIHWNINSDDFYNQSNHYYYYCHEVVVKYGILVTTGGGNNEQ